jgi:hypothetical protein
MPDTTDHPPAAVTAWRGDLLAMVQPRPFMRSRVLEIGLDEAGRSALIAPLGRPGVVLEPEAGWSQGRAGIADVEFIRARPDAAIIERLGKFAVVVIGRLERWAELPGGGLRALIAAAQSAGDTLLVDIGINAQGQTAIAGIADAGDMAALLAQSGLHGRIDCLGVHGEEGAISLAFRSRRAAGNAFHALSPATVAALEAAAVDRAPLAGESGSGIDSVVWRLQLDDGRNASFKMVEADEADRRALLFREHEFLSAVGARGVPTVRGWAISDRRYYLLTDWIDGASLATPDEATLARLADAAARTAIVDALNAIVRALGAAGIEHRAIRPENVLLRGADPVLINFGGACWLDEDAPTLDGQPAENDGIALDRLIAALP